MFQERRVISELLSEIKERMKGHKTIQTIRTSLSECLGAKPKYIRDFSYKINGHTWKGCIYIARNSLMGSIFSYWDSKPFIIRGYPKIRYALDTKLLNKAVTVQMKYDGTNIGLFQLPNKELMGKTRLMPRWDVDSLEAMKRSVSHWKELFIKIENRNLLQRILKLAKEDYLIFGELFGYLNPGEFIQYSVPIAYLVFDIIDLRTFKFISSRDAEALCSKFEIPFVETLWTGILTRKEIERIEYEAKQYIIKDGYEGFVAKHFSTVDRDMHFCKLKSEEIKEKSWKVRTAGIPALIIRKAIRKAMESYPYYSKIEQLYPIVREELLEEVEPALVDQSEKKIKSTIRRILLPIPEELRKSVHSIMLELKSQGIDLQKKREVLSALAFRLGDVPGKLLFKLYHQVLLELEE